MDVQDASPITIDTEDNLLSEAQVKVSRSGPLRFALCVPWFTVLSSCFLVLMYYTVHEFDALALDSAYPRQAWRWLTYAWFHWSTLHLWPPAAGAPRSRTRLPAGGRC